jgi:excinuclease ABC subunit A
MIEALSIQHGFSKDLPVKALDQTHVNLVLYGDKERNIEIDYRTRRGGILKWKSLFEGVIPNLERRYRETESEYVKREIEKYMAAITCQQCKGKRLKPQSLVVEVSGKKINEITSMTIEEAILWVNSLYKEKSNLTNANVYKDVALTERERTIAIQIIREIDGRLRFLNNVGLDYLTLDRTASTLSGGESQRIRLATQIGSGLTGVLYVCDEPSIGLHPVDDNLLIETLKNLRDLGNSIVIVEHDETIMRAADHIIDMGPGAGAHGGEVVAQGTLEDICNNQNSLTGLYLSGQKKIDVPNKRRKGNGYSITIKGARENNLRNVNVSIPLGKLVCITGVSGSGKSTLIYQVLYKKLAQILLQSREKPGLCDRIEGIENIDKIVNIDQSPIGRTPRSNPSTYSGVFTFMRELFATVPEARVRGYKPGRFSFNVKGGRCEACSGGGYIQIEMQFLPDVTVPCEICHGKRYNREALDIMFKGKNIAQVLDLTVSEALEFFDNFPRVRNKLETMADVGLGYIKLSQPATTLSGGEAQRLKLSTELSRRATGKTLYILDEPTTGLSFEDCSYLLRVLHRLVDSGNTVVLIEHHLDLIKNADWIIDLGPGAGNRGGKVVATGTPENIAKAKNSKTGPYIKDILK